MLALGKHVVPPVLACRWPVPHMGRHPVQNPHRSPPKSANTNTFGMNGSADSAGALSDFAHNRALCPHNIKTPAEGHAGWQR